MPNGNTSVKATAPSDDQPTDVSRPSDDGWPIPWQGRTARLTVTRPLLGSSASVLVDGVRVATVVKSTLENPWVECELPGAGSAVTVVLIQEQEFLAKIMVFVNGVSVDDGLTLGDWRTRRPVPIDGFEQSFGCAFWGPWGALLLGFVGALPFLAQFGRTKDGIWAGWAVLGFLVGSSWMLVGVLLIRWLTTKRSWPSPLRRLIVPAVLLGLPILIVLAISSSTKP